MAPAPQLIVVIGGSPELLRALESALPKGERRFSSASDESWSSFVTEHPVCLLIDSAATRRAPPQWVNAVEARAAIPLVAMVDSPLDAVAWLRGGAADWFLRAQPDALVAVLARLERTGVYSGRGPIDAVPLEQRLRDLFHSTDDTIILYEVAPDGRVVCEDLNPAAERAVGLRRHHARGRTPRELFEPESAAKLEQRIHHCVRTRASNAYEHELHTPTGTRRLMTSIVPVLDQQGQVHRLAAISRDVTHLHEAELLRRSLEAQMAEAQKNEALARVASHIAHDVNALLTTIAGQATRLMDAGPSDAAQAILQATSRGRELTQQVLMLGRRRPPERKPLMLAPLVRETMRLLESTAAQLTVREQFVPDAPQVLVDPSQIHQVLTNLFTNAVHAMPTGGTLTVSLSAVDVDEALATRSPGLQAGRWARLSVSDTGQGMDTPTTQRIFEPFFSVREGAGSGLELALVHSIVSAHDGVIVVDSGVGRGTTFHVYLPAFAELSERPGSGRRLLLVDDHPGMARVSAKLLETLGYHTSVFDDPRDALTAFRAAPESFDALLTDLSMPHMSGEELTRAVRAVRARIPVIVSSGRAVDLQTDELKALGIDGVLIKPWRLEEAVATLERVLQAAGG